MKAAGTKTLENVDYVIFFIETSIASHEWSEKQQKKGDEPCNFTGAVVITQPLVSQIVSNKQ